VERNGSLSISRSSGEKLVHHDQLQPLVTQSNVTRADATQEPAIGGFKTDDGEAIKAGAHISRRLQLIAMAVPVSRCRTVIVSSTTKLFRVFSARTEFSSPEAASTAPAPFPLLAG